MEIREVIRRWRTGHGGQVPGPAGPSRCGADLGPPEGDPVPPGPPWASNNATGHPRPPRPLATLRMASAGPASALQDTG